MNIYERTELVITEFDVEDVITTSSANDPNPQEYEIIKKKAPGAWVSH